MSNNYGGTSRQVAEYLQSTVKLDAVDIMTKKLNADLADSQRIMSEIKAIFDCIPNPPSSYQKGNHENVTTILDAAPPNLLMPDMVDNTADIDVDDVIATMKGYVEGLKKTVQEQKTSEKFERKNIGKLDLVPYATSLGQLSKRLANLKLGKRNETNPRSAELETKLAHLCQDVNMFSKMIESKKTLSVNNSGVAQLDDNSVEYEEIITKISSALNELTYLLHNRN